MHIVTTKGEWRSALIEHVYFGCDLLLWKSYHYDNEKQSETNLVSIIIQCVPQKRKPINQVNFSENCNDLSEKDYIFTKFSLSSFFWHQLQDVLAMHEQALTI